MSKVRVGIADDNKDFCNILADFLEKQQNIEVVFKANDGMQTVDSVLKNKPDVLLLDMIMPIFYLLENHLFHVLQRTALSLLMVMNLVIGQLLLLNLVV